MRNLLLGLVLANLFLLAWQFWVDPSPVKLTDTPADAQGGGLALFRSRNTELKSPEGPAVAAVEGCLQVGPFPDDAAARQARELLAQRGFTGELVARDAQRWLGHWVHIAGFASTAEAEAARKRLVAGGIADVLLMQDGSRPLISLGVFRDRDGAASVAAAAARLGYRATTSDRYRPTVEQWLLIQPLPGQRLALAETGLQDDLIRRAEPAACEESAYRIDSGAAESQ